MSQTPFNGSLALRSPAAEMDNGGSLCNPIELEK